VIVLARRGLSRLHGFCEGQEAIATSVRAGTNIFGEPAAVLFRGDALRATGSWSSEFPYAVDVELYFRMLEIGGVVALRQPDAAFRIHKGSWSAAVGSMQSSQIRALFESWASRPASRITRLDLFIGAMRARLLQAARSAVLSGVLKALVARSAAQRETWLLDDANTHHDHANS